LSHNCLIDGKDDGKLLNLIIKRGGHSAAEIRQLKAKLKMLALACPNSRGRE
jgi:hypothetical protein